MSEVDLSVHHHYVCSLPSQASWSFIFRDDNGVSRFLIKKQGLQYLFGGRLFDE